LYNNKNSWYYLINNENMNDTKTPFEIAAEYEYPCIQNGKAENIESFYKQVIAPQFENIKAIKRIHKAIMVYVQSKNPIFFSEDGNLYASMDAISTYEDHLEKFKEEIPQYMIKHQVRPGLTGWAQVNGYRGDTSIEKISFAVDGTPFSI